MLGPGLYSLNCSNVYRMKMGEIIPGDHRSYKHYLKGQCHAIWQLYKKLQGVFWLTEFQK